MAFLQAREQVLPLSFFSRVLFRLRNGIPCSLQAWFLIIHHLDRSETRPTSSLIVFVGKIHLYSLSVKYALCQEWAPPKTWEQPGKQEVMKITDNDPRLRIMTWQQAEAQPLREPNPNGKEARVLRCLAFDSHKLRAWLSGLWGGLRR